MTIEELEKEFERLHIDFCKECYNIGIEIGKELAEKYKNNPEFRKMVDDINRTGEAERCDSGKN